MLRKFKIKIDGQEYLVEMEEIGAVAPAMPQAPVAPQVAATSAPVQEAPVEVPASAASVPAGEGAMPSPMPGVILRVLVNVGDQVKQNQPLMILEAMKMENEVVASCDGVVAGIHVTEGKTVNAGDALITIQ